MTPLYEAASRYDYQLGRGLAERSQDPRRVLMKNKTRTNPDGTITTANSYANKLNEGLKNIADKEKVSVKEVLSANKLLEENKDTLTPKQQEKLNRIDEARKQAILEAAKEQQIDSNLLNQHDKLSAAIDKVTEGTPAHRELLTRRNIVNETMRARVAENIDPNDPSREAAVKNEVSLRERFRNMAYNNMIGSFALPILSTMSGGVQAVVAPIGHYGWQSAIATSYNLVEGAKKLLGKEGVEFRPIPGLEFYKQLFDLNSISTAGRAAYVGAATGQRVDAGMNVGVESNIISDDFKIQTS
jgi:hypothetical protein